MPTELDPTLSTREILMRATVHGDLTTKGSNLANTEVDNNFIIIYETIKSIFIGSGVLDYDAAETYAANEIVIESDIVYLSLQAANTDNTPGVPGSEAWWGLCSLGDMIKIMFAPANTPKSGITATGTNQATAKTLSRVINRIDTVASGTGVKNSALEAIGFRRTVQNNGANDLVYYPFLGSRFYEVGTGAMAINAGITIAPGNQISVIAYASGVLTLI